MKNPIIDEIKTFASMDWEERQGAFFKYVESIAKPVVCVPVSEVFTPLEIRVIKRVLRPQKRQCYRNAALLTELFPDRCRYVEGYGWNVVSKTEHAFNIVDGKYVDITWELALGRDISKDFYVSLIEASRDEVIADISAHGNITGDYFIHQYIKNLKTA